MGQQNGLTGRNSQSRVEVSFCSDSEDSLPWFVYVCEFLTRQAGSSANRGRNENHDRNEQERKESNKKALHSDSKLIFKDPANDHNAEYNNKLSSVSVERISYYPTENQLEAIINNISVNIVPNDFCSYGFSVILEEYNNISTNNLFKRCVLLSKLWCLFEAPAIMSVHASKGTYTDL